MNEHVRIEIGFDGGGLLSALVGAAEADRLAAELASASTGVVGFEASDGQYAVNLARVAYLKRFARESRVGFGGS